MRAYLDQKQPSTLMRATQIKCATCKANGWLSLSMRNEMKAAFSFADAYGYAPVFYSLISGVAVIVSDSFQGLSLDSSILGTLIH